MSTTLVPQTSRILIEADLKPLQGERFQPTGFPDLGHATYRTASGTEMLLVESAQSVANRLETVCWDEAALDLMKPLLGLSYVRVMRDGKLLTTSVHEAHRVNSFYIEGSSWFTAQSTALVRSKNEPVDLHVLHQWLCKWDLGSLLHGVFLESIDGRLRVARALSGFVEARDVTVVTSGGAKVDRVQPSTKSSAGEERAGSDQGAGNVIYHREEYTAGAITAFFNIDLAQIRSYRLPDPMTELLTTLALWKVLAFLDQGLRLRTACDLEVAGSIRVTRPEGFALPKREELEARLATLIAKAASAGLFASPAVTVVEYQPPKSSKGKGKKKSGDEDGAGD